jgi:hypothetical protein
MPASAASTRLGAATDLAAPDLEEGREALAYWEDRAQRLPRHAVRRRREAREMAARWHARVADAERAAYGRGLLGALVLFAAERRLPETTRHAGHQVVHRTTQAAMVVVVAVVALLAAGAIAAVELIAAILQALA